MAQRRQGRLWHHHTRGQSLVLIAICLPFLVMLILGAIELGGRQLRAQQVTDALRRASRSAVQALDYRAFASDGERPDNARVQGIARQVFAVNLSSITGLDEPIEALAARVHWQILPDGGTCTLPGSPPIHFTTAAVCAEVRPHLAGLLNGSFAPQISAAETIDRLVDD